MKDTKHLYCPGCGHGIVHRIVAEVLEEMGFSQLPLIGLAKREEEIVRPGIDEPLKLPGNSEALRLLQRVRDEAHRFAIRYHRGLRQGAQRSSRLDRVPGVGPVRRRLLLRHFGSLEKIRQAAPEELAQIPGMGAKLAQTIWEALHETLPTDGESRGKSSGE